DGADRGGRPGGVRPRRPRADIPCLRRRALRTPDRHPDCAPQAGSPPADQCGTGGASLRHDPRRCAAYRRTSRQTRVPGAPDRGERRARSRREGGCRLPRPAPGGRSRGVHGVPLPRGQARQARALRADDLPHAGRAAGRVARPRAGAQAGYPRGADGRTGRERPEPALGLGPGALRTADRREKRMPSTSDAAVPPADLDDRATAGPATPSRARPGRRFGLRRRAVTRTLRGRRTVVVPAERLSPAELAQRVPFVVVLLLLIGAGVGGTVLLSAQTTQDTYDL